jgi:hypothetical protein
LDLPIRQIFFYALRQVQAKKYRLT